MPFLDLEEALQGLGYSDVYDRRGTNGMHVHVPNRDALNDRRRYKAEWSKKRNGMSGPKMKRGPRRAATYANFKKSMEEAGCWGTIVNCAIGRSSEEEFVTPFTLFTLRSPGDAEARIDVWHYLYRRGWSTVAIGASFGVPAKEVAKSLADRL